MICRKCGQKLIEDSRYCENCGEPVNEEAPNGELVIPQSNQQGIPGVSRGAGIPNVSSTPNPQIPQRTKKPWVWIVVIALIILVCLCVAITGGGLIYLRNQNLSLKDLFANTFGAQPDIPEVSINTPIPEEEALPEPQVEAPGMQVYAPEDTLLVVTSSGIWAVNEQTIEAEQISNDQVDAPSWDLNQGMSPDKKYFSYITGLNDETRNPTLVVLSFESLTPIFQLELTGPGGAGTHGDPAFETLSAIGFSNSLAWSPDGTRLAFIANLFGESADVYLFDPTDNTVFHLSEEEGHAADLHWSPDGQLLQYVSVNTFGTGAGSDMEGLWVYDFQSKQAQLLENLDSNGEEFLAWEDNNRFWINSSSRTCGGAYNLRIVDAISHDRQVIVGEGFTAVAYDPENKFGMFSVAYNYDNCGSGEPLDAGLMIFGESVPVLGADGPIIGEIGRKKFEQVIAYGIGFIPQGNLFAIYGDDGLQDIYYKGQYGYNSLEILPEVKGFVPYPSPTGEYWAWASRNKTGLWVTENNSNPVELSSSFSGVPQWSLDGQLIHFYENDQLFSASAPQYGVNLIGEFPGEEILGVIK